MRGLAKIKSKYCTKRAEGRPDLEIPDHFLDHFSDPDEVQTKIKSKSCTNGGGPSNRWSSTRMAEMPT